MLNNDNDNNNKTMKICTIICRNSIYIDLVAIAGTSAPVYFVHTTEIGTSKNLYNLYNLAVGKTTTRSVRKTLKEYFGKPGPSNRILSASPP